MGPLLSFVEDERSDGRLFEWAALDRPPEASRFIGLTVAACKINISHGQEVVLVHKDIRTDGFDDRVYHRELNQRRNGKFRTSSDRIRLACGEILHSDDLCIGHVTNFDIGLFSSRLTFQLLFTAWISGFFKVFMYNRRKKCLIEIRIF